MCGHLLLQVTGRLIMCLNTVMDGHQRGIHIHQHSLCHSLPLFTAARQEEGTSSDPFGLNEIILPIVLAGQPVTAAPTPPETSGPAMAPASGPAMASGGNKPSQQRKSDMLGCETPFLLSLAFWTS